MGSISPTVASLPDSNSPNLHLTHPTPEERLFTWKLNSTNWSGALNPDQYIDREKHLMAAPLAADGGLTHWILVDKSLPPNDRPILASCETIRKRALLSDKDRNVSEVITHGVGAVFCDPAHRGRGYASRIITDLREVLRTYQAEERKCAFTVLWSDIGKVFYAGHGWHPFPSTHVEISSKEVGNEASKAQPLFAEDLALLCKEDEAMIRGSLKAAKDNKIHVAIMPDHLTMQWHHAREEFLAKKLFSKQPRIKGAIVGEPGSRMWAIWTRSFNGNPESATSGNTLHILRLVIEGELPATSFSSGTGGSAYDGTGLQRRTQDLAAILKIAQAEAAEWKLLHVELWNPTPMVQDLLERTNIVHSKIERQQKSIASLLWYGEGSGNVDDVEWVGNEKFAWC